MLLSFRGAAEESAFEFGQGQSPSAHLCVSAEFGPGAPYDPMPQGPIALTPTCGIVYCPGMLKLKRLCAAIVLAFPLVWLATAIGDNPSTPGLVRIAISPGMAVALHLPMWGQGGWLDAVAQTGMTALALNLLY